MLESEAAVPALRSLSEDFLLRGIPLQKLELGELEAGKGEVRSEGNL